jgi:hypothetical protein
VNGACGTLRYSYLRESGHETLILSQEVC